MIAHDAREVVERDHGSPLGAERNRPLLGVGRARDAEGENHRDDAGKHAPAKEDRHAQKSTRSPISMPYEPRAASYPSLWLCPASGTSSVGPRVTPTCES